jgi:hypothetical protein
MDRRLQEGALSAAKTPDKPPAPATLVPVTQQGSDNGADSNATSEKD